MPSRRRRIVSRSAGGSQRTRSGLSNAASHAASQTKPIDPAARNPARQPSQLTTEAIATAPIAGPAAAPALNTALARPRSEAGNHSRITRLDAGQLVDSPMPIATRDATMNPKPVENPVSTVAADHSPMPAALTIRPPNRSTSRPTGSRQSTYIHRKDDSR